MLEHYILITYLIVFNHSVNSVGISEKGFQPKMYIQFVHFNLA